MTCIPKGELGAAREAFYSSRLGPLADKLISCSKKLASYLFSTSSRSNRTPTNQLLSEEERTNRITEASRIKTLIESANRQKANRAAYFSELNTLSQYVLKYRILIEEGAEDCTTVALCYQNAYKDLPKACPEPPKPKATNKRPKKEEPKKECPEPGPDKWGVRFRYKVGKANTCLPSQPSQESVALSNTPSSLDIAASLTTGLASAIVNNPGKYEERDWFLSLLPAMRSVLPIQGGVDTPNAMPGLQFRVISNIAKHRVPGFQPIYQHLGVEATYITLVGTFTGDGGLGAITKYDSANEWISRERQTSEAGVASREEDDFINRVQDPSYQGVPGGTKGPGGKYSMDYLPVNPLPDRPRETEIPSTYLNGSLFTSDGCPGECPEKISTDPQSGRSNLVQPYNVTTHQAAKPLWEIASQLDSYHEFVSFYKIAVQQGNELEVEINVRRNNDGLKPRKGIESDPLRNIQTGNPRFKGYVRRMEVYHARSDRTWYSIEMEVTDHALAGTKAINLTHQIDQTIKNAIAAQLPTPEGEVAEEQQGPEAQNLNALEESGVKSITGEDGTRYLVLPPGSEVREQCLTPNGNLIRRNATRFGLDSRGCPVGSSTTTTVVIDNQSISIGDQPYIRARTVNRRTPNNQAAWIIEIDGRSVVRSPDNLEPLTQTTNAQAANSTNPSPTGAASNSVSPARASK